MLSYAKGINVLSKVNLPIDWKKKEKIIKVNLHLNSVHITFSCRELKSSRTIPQKIDFLLLNFVVFDYNLLEFPFIRSVQKSSMNIKH